MDSWLYALTLFAVLTCGTMAGLFFTFSVFVMRALARLPSPQGMVAMQSINGAIQTPFFGLAIFGSTFSCLALGVYSLATWPEEAGWLVAGSVVYLLGAIVLTGRYHIPRNDALDRIDPRSPEAESRWTRYLAEWVPWNHLRTVSSLFATGSFAVALH